MEKIYVLLCRDQHFYVGQTSNVDRRFAEHLDEHFLVLPMWTDRTFLEQLSQIFSSRLFQVRSTRSLCEHV